jgi:hypothetical protein
LARLVGHNFCPDGDGFGAILEALPHLIQLGGLVVVCLTAVQKLIELGWIKNPRARKQEAPDDIG